MTIDRTFTIADLITPLDTIIRGKPEETLGSVLSEVNSSHSAVFIFDNDSNFLGLVSPYKTLYSSKYPHKTKVESILYRPPTITKDTPIYEAAVYMLASKIYSLPVFDSEGVVIGVINGKNLVQHIADDSLFLQFISQTIQPRKPIITHKNSTVKDVYHLLREKGVSRIILVDDEGDLAGIVTRGDLMHAFIKPVSRQGKAKEGVFVGNYFSLEGEKKFRKDDPVLKYATMMVNSIPDDRSPEAIVTHLIESPQNSIVLVDKNNKPTGFLSTRDILQAISLLKPEEDIPIIMKKPSGVSTKDLEFAEEHLLKFCQKLKKRMAVEKIEVSSKEPKNINGESKAFNITLIVTPVAGKPLVAVAKQSTYIDSIQQVTTLIEKQRKRKRLNTKETRYATA